MGGGKGGGLSPQVQQGMLSNQSALTAIAEQQNQRAGTLFDVGLPGVQQAESFYQSLASGDPYQIARATAPAAQQIDKAAASAKANILQNAPPGGAKNLALEEVDVNKGAQIGDIASKGYLGSFNALANIGGQNIQQSISSAGTAISGFGQAGQTLSSLGGLQIQNAQLQAEEKGGMFGQLSQLAESGASMGLMAAGAI